MKTCLKCGESKPIEAFSKNKNSNDGHLSKCKLCRKIYMEEYRKANAKQIAKTSKEWREKNKSKINANARKRWTNDEEYRNKKTQRSKAYVQQNREKTNQYFRDWSKRNPQSKYESQRRWRQNNTDHVNHLNRLRETSVIKRTPHWLTDCDFILIKKKYELAKSKTQSTGEQWVVDHILPLRGELVSGLHVPSNLRVIKATTNARKYNKYVPV